MIPRSAQIAIALMLAGVLGAGVFMLRLKQREVAKLQSAEDSRSLSAPLSGPKEQVRLAIAYDDDHILRREERSAALPQEPGDRAREILRVLLAEYLKKPSVHPLADGSDVKDVFLLKDGLCVVDLNLALAEGHRSGIVVEELTLASIIETLALNQPSIRQVKFLVEGRDRETLAGHADLRLTYDVPAVHELVAEME